MSRSSDWSCAMSERLRSSAAHLALRPLDHAPRDPGHHADAEREQPLRRVMDVHRAGDEEIVEREDSDRSGQRHASREQWRQAEVGRVQPVLLGQRKDGRERRSVGPRRFERTGDACRLVLYGEQQRDERAQARRDEAEECDESRREAARDRRGEEPRRPEREAARSAPRNWLRPHRSPHEAMATRQKMRQA